MGLFRKKRDPVSERARTLNQQIAALESEIQKLSTVSADATAASPAPKEKVADVPAKPQASSSASGNAPSSATGSVQPRLRSTAFPVKNHPPQAGPPTQVPKANPFAEPVFEDVGQTPGKEQVEPANPGNPNDLGVRKYDLPSLWRRLTNHFRGPATSNPKLVNYLAAGSIQGLRPLRYEKRVARNRFIFFVLVLIAVLWGLIAVWIKRS